MGTLFLRNEIQVVLWEREICGQISDGAWENTEPNDHWKAWANANAVVARTECEMGRDFDVLKDDYDLINELDIVFLRMVDSCEAAGYPIDRTRLVAELADMGDIMKIRSLPQGGINEQSSR